MKKILSFLLKDTSKIFISAILLIFALITEKLEFYILSVIIYALALLVSGISVYIDAVKGLLRRDFLDEKFLMSLASIGAMLIGERAEGVAVMLFFLLGETFERQAVNRSRRKIRALMDICPDDATVIRDGVEFVVDADDIEVGDVLVLRAGDRLAADSIVIKGCSDADVSHLTGESLPVSLNIGDYIESGTVIINGLLNCRAVKKPSESGAQRILDMVEEAGEKKSKEEKFITSFSKVYTPIVVMLAILVAVIPVVLRTSLIIVIANSLGVILYVCR